MKKTILFLMILGCFISNAVNAEMISVKVKWNTISCQRSCYETLLPKLQAIPGVANVQFNAAFGEAKLEWRPNVPFSLDSVVTPLKLYGGGGVLAMEVEVRGTIYHSGDQVYLISSGDNVRYFLLGQVQYQKNRWVMERSIYNHPLDPQMKLRLIEAEQNHEIVTIHGTLYGIETHQLNLIVLDVKYPDKEKK